MVLRRCRRDTGCLLPVSGSSLSSDHDRRAWMQQVMWSEMPGQTDHVFQNGICNPHIVCFDCTGFPYFGTDRQRDLRVSSQQPLKHLGGASNNSGVQNNVSLMFCSCVFASYRTRGAPTPSVTLRAGSTVQNPSMRMCCGSWPLVQLLLLCLTSLDVVVTRVLHESCLSGAALGLACQCPLNLGRPQQAVSLL